MTNDKYRVVHLAPLQVLTHRAVEPRPPIGERLLDPSGANAKLVIGSSVAAPYHESMQALLSRCGRSNAKDRPDMEEVLQEVTAVLERLRDVSSGEEVEETALPLSAKDRTPTAAPAAALALSRRAEGRKTRPELPDLTPIHLGDTHPRG